MRVHCLLLLAALAGCHEHEDGHDHSTAHPAGHDHHAPQHGHSAATESITLWSGGFELFAEHEAAVVGQPISLLAHLTWLEDFSPLTEGTVTLELEGPATIRGTTKTPLRRGIYVLEATPPTAGVYRGRVRVKGRRSGTVEGIEITVTAEATAETEEEEDVGVIEFLKEQQWGVPFDTIFPSRSHLVATVTVPGRIDTPPDGQAVVAAPVTGRVVAPRAGLVRPGQQVKKGQTLASFVPAPSSPEEVARTKLAVAEAEGRLQAAKAALDRAQRLYRDEAIAKRELEDAEREATIAEEAVRSAQRTAALFSGASGSGREGAWRLSAPIAGTIAAVRATPGATLAAGATLFSIVDTRVLWIVARVPEQDATRLRTDVDASFSIAGDDRWIPIALGGASPTASVVAVAPKVDERTRTVDVVYALNDTTPAMRVGGLVEVALPTGDDFEGVVVPRSAIVDREGKSVVYVQVDGEHFAERLVRVGPRAGGRVGIVSGLAVEERVVTEGAHLVRLAQSAAGEPAHGHIH